MQRPPSYNPQFFNQSPSISGQPQTINPAALGNFNPATQPAQNQGQTQGQQQRQMNPQMLAAYSQRLAQSQQIQQQLVANQAHNSRAPTSAPNQQQQGFNPSAFQLQPGMQPQQQPTPQVCT